MKIESIRKDKTAIKIDGNWKQLAPNVVDFIKNKNVIGLDVEIEEDKNYITKIKINYNKELNKSTSFMSSKDRAVCLSYAKDLVIAKIIKTSEMYEVAESMLKYVKTGERP